VKTLETEIEELRAEVVETKAIFEIEKVKKESFR
jgi:hypothetical protein